MVIPARAADQKRKISVIGHSRSVKRRLPCSVKLLEIFVVSGGNFRFGLGNPPGLVGFASRLKKHRCDQSYLLQIAIRDFSASRWLY